MDLGGAIDMGTVSRLLRGSEVNSPGPGVPPCASFLKLLYRFGDSVVSVCGTRFRFPGGGRADRFSTLNDEP